jgi:uncharacterized protein (TIGR01777 family)
VNIAITGATGFVGSQLATAAGAAGHRVVAFSRRAGPDSRFDEVRRFRADDPMDFSGCDAVVHLAGESVAGYWTAEKKRRIRESRVAGTRQVVASLGAAEPRPDVLVSASAIGIYGDTGETEADESTSPGDGFLADVARAWEEEALKAEALGVRVVLPRISLVLGPDGGALESMTKLFRLGLGGRIGDGRQWMSWIHRDDLVAMILKALTNPEWSGACNAATPHPVRNSEFTKALAKAVQRPALFPVPAFLLRTILGEFAGEILGSRRVAPRRTAELGFSFGIPTLDAALSDIVNRPS